jgi:hypothetical protein
VNWESILPVLISGLIGLFTVYIIYTMKKSDTELATFKLSVDKGYTDIRNESKAVHFVQEEKISELTKDLTQLNNKQIEHEIKFVTDSQVRTIFKEEVSDIKDDISTVKGNVTVIMDSMNKLTIQLEVQNQLRSRNEV